MEKKKINILPIILLLFATIFIALNLNLSPISKQLPNNDSSIFLYFGNGMLQGKQPYIDMFDHKGPFLFYLNAIGSLFGSNFVGVWFLEIIACFTTLYFSYLTCCQFTSKKVALFSTLLPTLLYINVLQGGNFSEEYALPFISLAFYLFTKLFLEKDSSKIQLLFIGISGALVFFLRVNMIALWFSFCLGLLFLTIKEKNWILLKKSALYIFLGGILVVIVMFSISFIYGYFDAMIDQSILLNLKYSASTLKDKIKASIYFYNLLPVFGYNIICVLFLFHAFREKKFSLFLLAYFVINWVTIILPGHNFRHYFLTQIPILVVFTAIVVQRSFSWKKISSSYLVIALLLIPIGAVPARYYSIKEMTSMSEETKELKDLGVYLKENTRKDDTIYVHKNGANLYLESERFANSKYFSLPLMDFTKAKEIKEDFLNQMNKNMPKYIVVKTHKFNTRKGLELNDELHEFIQEKQYKLAKKTATYSVFLK